LQEDQARTLINVISDTGMRLAEASGLVKSDLFLYHKVPYLQVVSHPWRSLKTKSSTRLIPLTNNVLSSLIKLSNEVEGEFLFPQFNKGEYTNANSASATLNKWIKSQIGGEYTVHSLRHSFRDRLRAAECPADIINQLGGWHTDGVGNQYGNGYTVEVLGKWVRLLE
jgi:integrase